MRKQRLTIFLAAGVALLTLLAGPAARSQSWQPLHNQAPFGASTALLLTDGRIMVHEVGGFRWFALVPDNTGSYVNGTWHQLRNLPQGYAPLYYASAVLPDGRVIVEGGEYNNGNAAWTNLGAIYNPLTNEWKSVTAPPGWGNIGDAQNAVLANGTFMLASCCSAQSALLDAKNLTWTITGAGKADSNNEEGWTLLRDKTVLTIDTNNPSGLTHAEKYLPDTGHWVSAGSTVVKLPDTNADNSGSHEIGPAVLRPDGTIFATGATGHTSVYYPPAKPENKGHWVPGPDFPVIGDQLDVADGPASLLPSGNVLVSASPGVFLADTHFFEFDGTNLTEVPGTPNALLISSFEGRMLLLPTGEVLYTDGSQDVEIYTAAGSPDPSWAPTITSAPTQVTRGTSYKISGTQFNGLSQAEGYGDDASAATNYPLVRVTNHATGHVFYARTAAHSTMGVGTRKKIVSTHFKVSAATETGESDLSVVANGIASAPVTVVIQ